MKNTILKYIGVLLVAPAILWGMASCSNEEDLPMSPAFQKITPLKDPTTSIKVGEMGDWVAIHGQNLETVSSILFNDIAVDMEEIYFEDGVIYLQVPVAMPGSINNKVVLTTSSGQFDFDFTVNIPKLKITGMFNEYTAPGDTLKIYGDFFKLYEVDKTTTTVAFGNLENPVIDAGNNYLTVKVPPTAGENLKLKVINKKYNTEASCPGYYRDRQNLITNYDDVPYKGSDGAVYVGSWIDPKPMSGKYSLVNIGSQGSGWHYMIGTGYSYSNDMKDNPDKYQLKFEINMVKPIMKTKLYIYNYWNHTPAEITAQDLVVQNNGMWQTLSIPLERIIPVGFTGNKSYIGSFNIRVDSPVGEAVLIGWDNFRISLED